MYQSPLHILSDWSDEGSDITETSQLLRLRKTLLAEFNLTNAATIDIGGRPYSKDEVIKTIDVLLDNPNMDLHLFVFRNKSLLDFLENDGSLVEEREIAAMDVPAEIKPLLNPFLLERYQFNFKRAFYNREFEEATMIVNNMPDFDEEERMEFYEGVHRNLRVMQEQVANYQEDDAEIANKELKYLKKESLAGLLNSLPEDFEGIINSLVTDIINTMVAHQRIKKHDRNFLYTVSKMLRKVNCSEDLKKLINDNHLVFSQNYSSGAFSFIELSSSGQVFYYMAIFAVIALVRLSTCRDRHTPTYPITTFRSNPTVITQSSKTPYEEFKDYRYFIFNIGTNRSILNDQTVPVSVDSTMNGKNPFRHILQYLKLNISDTGLRKVVLVNKSYYHLIAVAFNHLDAKASFFSDQSTDTFEFRPGDKICFYFGNTLAINSEMQRYVSTYQDKHGLEVFFKNPSEETIQMLRNDYQIDLKKQKRPGKNPGSDLPVLEIGPDFFKNDSIETKTLKLVRLPGKLDHNF